MKRLALILSVLSSTPAAAGEFVLMIENAAGSVATYEGMTRKECDAVAALLGPGREREGSTSGGSSGGSSGGLVLGSITGVINTTPPASPRIVKVRCVLPSEAKQ